MGISMHRLILEMLISKDTHEFGIWWRRLENGTRFNALWLTLQLSHLIRCKYFLYDHKMDHLPLISIAIKVDS